MFRSLVASCIMALMCNLLVFGVLPVHADETDPSETPSPPSSMQEVQKVQEVSADEAAKGIVGGRFDVILDVRQPEEYEQMHIPGAVLISLDDLKEEAREELKGPAKSILVYCALGGRSLEATKILSDMGFTNVTNLRGGIMAWKKEGYPVAK